MSIEPDPSATRTAAETLRGQANHLEGAATQLDASVVAHRERVRLQEQRAADYRERAAEHHAAADQLDRLDSGGVVVNVHVTDSGEDVTRAVAEALQRSANRAAQ